MVNWVCMTKGGKYGDGGMHGWGSMNGGGGGHVWQGVWVAVGHTW